MNARFLAAFLCLATLSGCIIHEYDDDDCCHTPPPAAYPGDVAFTWTLQNLRCDDVRDIKGVNIRIPGEQLRNEGRYACSTAGIDGIELHNFAPGSYRFEMDAVDYQGVVRYTAAGSFIINGNVRVSVDLMPVGAAPSYSLVSWSFPNNASCAQVGVAKVRTLIDGIPDKEVLCSQGNSTQTRNLQPGDHSIEIIALDGNGNTYYYTRGGLTTQANNPVAQHYSLTAVGTLTLNWAFSRDGGATALGCEDVGVSTLSIDFQNSTGGWVYNGVGTSGDCSPPTGMFRTMVPGRYRISVLAKNANNVTYRSADNVYVDVVAFQQRTVTVVLHSPTPTQP